MEEVNMLKTIRMFATKGIIPEAEFECGEDDMAYIIDFTQSSPPLTTLMDSLPSAAATRGGIRRSESMDETYVSKAPSARPRRQSLGSASTLPLFDKPATDGWKGNTQNTPAFADGLADSAGIMVANDLVTLPLSSTPKQRLSISFAIAQSSLLSVFEARVQQKIVAYKFIPKVSQ